MTDGQFIPSGLPWPACYVIGGLTGAAYLHFALDWGWLSESLIGGIGGGIVLGSIMRKISLSDEVVGDWTAFRGISLVSCVSAFAGLLPAFLLANLSVRFAALFSNEQEYPPYMPYGLSLVLPILCFSICGVLAGMLPGYINAVMIKRKRGQANKNS